jgi:hypothetical protein
MVETIAPVVYGRARSRYWLSVCAHACAATGAAGAVGAVLGTVGRLAGAPWGSAGLAALAAIAALYGLAELTGVSLPAPRSRRQVPDWWRTFFSLPVAAALYGAGLGVGLLTFLRHATFLVVAAAAVAGGDPVVGAALCAPFGLARGLSVAIGATADQGSAVGRLEALEATGVVGVANGVALTVIGATAALAALARP